MESSGNALIEKNIMSEKKYLQINNSTWYCISLFYSHKDIAVLMESVALFYLENKTSINHISIYLSNAKGERLNIVIVSEHEDKEFMCHQIHDYFSKVIKNHPSEADSAIQYGNMIWMDYPNNSIAWNVFDIPDFLLENQEVCLFSMYMSLLIMDLYDEESSIYDNKKTIIFFLVLQLIKALNVDIATVFATANSEDNDVVDMIDDTTDSLQTMSSYWDFNDDTDSNFDLWLEQIKRINNSMNWGEKYHLLTSVICSQLDILPSYLQSDIIPLLVKWNKWRNQSGLS